MKNSIVKNIKRFKYVIIFIIVFVAVKLAFEFRVPVSVDKEFQGLQVNFPENKVIKNINLKIDLKLYKNKVNAKEDFSVRDNFNGTIKIDEDVYDITGFSKSKGNDENKQWLSSFQDKNNHSHIIYIADNFNAIRIIKLNNGGFDSDYYAPAKELSDIVDIKNKMKVVEASK